MTPEEEKKAWGEWRDRSGYTGVYIEDSEIVDWREDDDGDISIRLYGEDFYRLIVRPMA